MEPWRSFQLIRKYNCRWKGKYVCVILSTNQSNIRSKKCTPLHKKLLHYFNFTPSQVQKVKIKRKDDTIQPRFFTVPPRALSASAHCILCPWAESNSQNCLWGWGASLPPRREQVFLMDPTSLWMSETSPLALPNRLWNPREENKCHKKCSLLFTLRAL